MTDEDNPPIDIIKPHRNLKMDIRLMIDNLEELEKQAETARRLRS